MAGPSLPLAARAHPAPDPRSAIEWVADGGLEVRLPLPGGPPTPAPEPVPVPAPTVSRVTRGAGTRGSRYASEPPITASGRDLRLDMLRGLCALVMIIDHVGGGSFLYGLTGGNAFVVSAAEGFIFLSGMLVGLVYGPRVERDGIGAVQWRLLRRAATLYGLTIAMTFLFVGLSRFASMPWLQDDPVLSPRLVVSLLTLHRTYYLVDVLVLYTLLMLLAPGALLLLARGRTGIALMLSLGVWGAYQVFPAEATVPWDIANNDTFRFPAWQVWFFVGMVVGYHRDAIRDVLSRIPQWLLVGVLAGLAIATITLHVTEAEAITQFLQAPSGEAVRKALFDKEFARPGRLVAFAIWFPFLYLVLTVAWRALAGVFGWLLVPFGQNALYVYAMHLFAVYLGALLLPYVPGFDRENPWHNTPVQVASVAVIWLAVRYRVLFDVVPR